MVNKIIVTLLAMSLSVFFFAIASAEENDSAELKEFYIAIIDDMAASCKFDSAMRHSDSENIRKACALSCLKTCYWTNKKMELADMMVKEDFGYKKTRALAYLNRKFHEMAKQRGLDVHSTTPLRALPEKPRAEFEHMKISEFCEHFSIPEGLVMFALEKKEIDAAKDKTFRGIADEKNMKYEEIYAIVREN
jgi:hypothetical protein